MMRALLLRRPDATRQLLKSQHALVGGCQKRGAEAVVGGRGVSLLVTKRYFNNPFTEFAQKKKIEELRKAIQATNGTDERKTAEYIRALIVQSPQEGILAIERGWESGKLAANEGMLREYFKAVGALKKFDSINISALLALLNKQGVLPAGGGGSAALAAAMSASRYSAGASPNEPLYIATPQPSWQSQAMKLLRTAVVAFFVLSFASSIMDEKGGGIGGRIMGSAIHQAEHSDKSFSDVVGIDEAKEELEEIVQYLKDPKRFTRLGGKLPKGVLLTGPPGTGKTLLARAIAGEAGVPFFFSSGSEFEEMYVGVGARRVRDLFEAAKNKSPCIIFIDEIDAIGGRRQEKDQSAMKMTLNQLLVEMDGFEQNAGVIVIAATNFPDSLDHALVRPGRFDKHVDVALPDLGGRKAILDLYCSKMSSVGSDVNTEQIARGTPGFSGADLFNLVNQAAIKASVDGLKSIGMAAFEHAKDKILMGVERKSAVISLETLRMTAFHEAGHALVSLHTAGCDPIHKATIMPRGRALGMVMPLADGDQTSQSRKQMLARLDMCMGGRVAEELVFGEDNVTSGAVSDIQQATRLARAMVTKYGLSEKVGIIYFDDKTATSGDTSKEIDAEVKALLTDSYARAKKLLETHRKELDIIAHGLIEYETLSGGEIVDLINGVPPNVKGVRSQRPSRVTQPLPVRRRDATASSSGSGGKPATPPAPPAKSKPLLSSPAPAPSSSSSNSSSFLSPPPSSSPTVAASPSAKADAAAKDTSSRGPPKA